MAVGAIARADAVVDAAFLDPGSRLRVVARTGVGVDLVDPSAARARGITVVVTPGSGTRPSPKASSPWPAPGQAAGAADRAGPRRPLGRAGPGVGRRPRRRHHRHRRLRPHRPPGRRARRGVRDAGTGPRPVQPAAAEVDTPDLGALAEASDVVTLHALIDQNRHLVGEAFLARVRPGRCWSTAAAGLLDLDAVLAALEAGRLAGVGLDVFDPSRRRTTLCSTTPTWCSPPSRHGADPPRHRGHCLADAARGVADVLRDAGPRPWPPRKRRNANAVRGQDRCSPIPGVWRAPRLGLPAQPDRVLAGCARSAWPPPSSGLTGPSPANPRPWLRSSTGTTSRPAGSRCCCTCLAHDPVPGSTGCWTPTAASGAACWCCRPSPAWTATTPGRSWTTTAGGSCWATRTAWPPWPRAGGAGGAAPQWHHGRERRRGPAGPGGSWSTSAWTPGTCSSAAPTRPRATARPWSGSPTSTSRTSTPAWPGGSRAAS